MQRLQVEPREIDADAFRQRGALQEDGPVLIETDTLLIHEGEPVGLYLKLADDALDWVELIRALRSIPYTTGARSTRGLKSTSRVFGYLPRLTIRRDFCSQASMGTEYPEAHAVLCSLGSVLDGIYREQAPAVHREHAELVERVLPEYIIPGSLFTSGIVNWNNPLRYHRDQGNFRGSWSAMIVARRDVAGGRLVLPELGVTFDCADRALVIFDGQRFMHGVTPFALTRPQGYRYTIVYYSMRDICNCLGRDAEVTRVRKVKTAREQSRALAARIIRDEIGQVAPTYPIYVLSTGRAYRASTPRVLHGGGLPCVIVCGPGEGQGYTERHPNARVIEAPNMTRVAFEERAFQDAWESKAEKLWLLEDSIGGFRYTSQSEDVVPVAPKIALGATEAWGSQGAQMPNMTGGICGVLSLLDRSLGGVGHRFMALQEGAHSIWTE